MTDELDYTAYGPEPDFNNGYDPEASKAAELELIKESENASI